MTEGSAQKPSPRPRALATAADIMQPTLTTVEPNDHVAAAAYLMHQAGATALVVVDDQKAKQPIGLITEADIVQPVAADRELHDLKIRALMTTSLVVITPDTSLREAAEAMVARHFRHLPVVSGSRLVDMAGISEICEAMLGIPSDDPSTTDRKHVNEYPPVVARRR